jgi:hypothetical protein
MKQKISEQLQKIVVYKINPNEEELNGDVNFSRNAHGRILTGNLFLSNNILIVEDENQKITGVFSLDHYYFIQSSNT